MGDKCLETKYKIILFRNFFVVLKNFILEDEEDAIYFRKQNDVSPMSARNDLLSQGSSPRGIIVLKNYSTRFRT